MKRLFIATTNPGKRREYATLLTGLGVELGDLSDLADVPEIVEDGSTFAENALIKARTVAALTGRAALGDDSGLEIDALGGAPGLRSARFADDWQRSHGALPATAVGPDRDTTNYRLALELLRDVRVEHRTAHFRCAIAVALPDGRTVSSEGTCDGVLLDAPRGTGGFGYDPIFLYPPLGLTCAEMTAVQKEKISHRGVAARALRADLESLLEKKE